MTKTCEFHHVAGQSICVTRGHRGHSAAEVHWWKPARRREPKRDPNVFTLVVEAKPAVTTAALYSMFMRMANTQNGIQVLEIHPENLLSEDAETESHPEGTGVTGKAARPAPRCKRCGQVLGGSNHTLHIKPCRISPTGEKKKETTS